MPRFKHKGWDSKLGALPAIPFIIITAVPTAGSQESRMSRSFLLPSGSPRWVRVLHPIAEGPKAHIGERTGDAPTAVRP